MAYPFATVHSGGFPAPLTVLLVVAAVAYVLWSRMRGQPLKVKRLLVLPVVLTVIGVTDLTSSGAAHLNSTDMAFLVVSVAISAVLGAARGATIELYPNQGELWQRYRRNTVGLWVALIATKLVVAVIASASGASAGGGTNSLLLSLGVSLLAEAAIVAPRALSTGLPFASDPKQSDHDRAGSAGGRPGQRVPGQRVPGQRVPGPRVAGPRVPGPPAPALAGSGRPGPSQSRWLAGDRAADLVLPHEVPPTTSRLGTAVDEPAWPEPGDDRAVTPVWRSPSVSEGINWLRRQLDQPGSTHAGRKAPSPGPADGVRNRDRDRDHHHHNHHGLTGRS